MQQRKSLDTRSLSQSNTSLQLLKQQLDPNSQSKVRELQQDVADLRDSNTGLQQKNMELLQQLEDKDNKYFGMQ